MSTQSKYEWNWRHEGFQFAPQRVRVMQPLMLYRVWGGTATEMGDPSRAGVCLAFERPYSRRQAEGLFSVWEWGNACRFVTQFQVLAGATIFVGRVHPGDFYDNGLGAPGSQVFVEADQVKRCMRKIGASFTLSDDLGSSVIVPNRDPGRDRSA